MAYGLWDPFTGNCYFFFNRFLLVWRLGFIAVFNRNGANRKFSQDSVLSLSVGCTNSTPDSKLPSIPELHLSTLFSEHWTYTVMQSLMKASKQNFVNQIKNDWQFFAQLCSSKTKSKSKRSDVCSDQTTGTFCWNQSVYFHYQFRCNLSFSPGMFLHFEHTHPFRRNLFIHI